MKLGKDELFKIAGVSQFSQFDQFIKDTLFNPERRTQFYKDILNINSDVSVDTFRDYFEEYAAERKSNKQDFTPDSVSELMSKITRNDNSSESGWSGYDPTAGTGSLIIKKWNDDRLAETPFSYAPHNYLYMVEELGDNVIPYLLHNIAIRGMNCIVIHGDTLERNIKQIYFVQNSHDDYMKFSDINVMPHTDKVKDEFNVSNWSEKAIEHVESGEVAYIPALPMHREHIITLGDGDND